MSQTTKRALAASLKKLLQERPLDKIAIVDITLDCGVNRQTFYYHFQDIYNLIQWIYTNEAPKAPDGRKTRILWQQGIMEIFEYALENKAFVMNTYYSDGRQYLEEYLYTEVNHLLSEAIEAAEAGITVAEEDKTFIIRFYKYAFVGLMLEWIDGEMKERPAVIIDRLSILIQGDIVRALEKFRIDRRFR